MESGRGSAVAQGFVGVVILVLPGERLLPHLIESPKDVDVKQFAVQAAVQSFEIGALKWTLPAA